MNTDPDPISLMSTGGRQLSPQLPSEGSPLGHLDAFHKLHLGWLRPRIPESHGLIVQTVAAHADAVTVLPRTQTDAREYFLIESRQNHSNDWTNPDYDVQTGAKGLAVYHVVEPGPSCFTEDQAGCVPLLPPPCVPSEVWDVALDNWVRPGLRLVQPDLTHIENSPLVFNSVNPATEILDEAPTRSGGTTCPTPSQIGLPGGVGYLMWSDLEPSGYEVPSLNTADNLGGDFEFELTVP